MFSFVRFALMFYVLGITTSKDGKGSTQELGGGYDRGLVPSTLLYAGVAQR